MDVIGHHYVVVDLDVRMMGGDGLNTVVVLFFQFVQINTAFPDVTEYLLFIRRAYGDEKDTFVIVNPVGAECVSVFH